MNNDKQIDIKITNLTKSYKLLASDGQRLKALLFPKSIKEYKHALNDVSLEIKRGERVAFIGKNGAGKSTILKIISGIIIHDKGEVVINRHVNPLFANTASFLGDFTGRENLWNKCILLGLSKKEIEEVEDDIIEFSEVGHEYIDMQMKRYSSGMAAKLGFAINFFVKNEILILDESLAVGDQIFVDKCFNEIMNRMKSGNDITLLFVSHQENMAKQFCTRGIFIDEGKIAFDGPINDAFDAYRKKYNLEEM